MAINVGDAVVYLGDCRDVLKTLPDNSVDSVVTDPPYELGFMGKKWDSTGIAYDVEVWSECLRVLKPGGHVLAFGGSRTWHRLAVAIEDSGFELRDSIAWIYGSGFPKSLNVSKAIDKTNAESGRVLRFVRWMKNTGLNARQIDNVLKERGLISPTSNRAVHYFNEGQPHIPTAEFWSVIRPMCGDVPAWVDELVARVEAEREVIGKKKGVKSPGFAGDRYSVNGGETVEVATTLPATSEAQKWQGWGTALKPAFEPIVVGRKPLIGTVAENVLEWGTGGLNIDGSRINYSSDADKEKALAGDAFKRKDTSDEGWSRPWMSDQKKIDELNAAAKERAQAGRWPANVMLDEYTAELLDQQSGVLISGKVKPGTMRGMKSNANVAYADSAAGSELSGYGDSGGASRFFYVAKASKRDRNEGLDELKETSAADMVEREPDSAGMNSPRAGAGRTSGAKNFHPTVKPTQLMRYLIKLVTPPGGTVLDPFTGSGSTGKAALLDGYKFVGAELTEEYLPIIEGRLKWAAENREDDDTLF